MKEGNYFTNILNIKNDRNTEAEIKNINNEVFIKYKRHLENLQFEVNKLNSDRDKYIKMLIEEEDERKPLHERAVRMSVGTYINHDVSTTEEILDKEAQIKLVKKRIKELF